MTHKGYTALLFYQNFAYSAVKGAKTKLSAPQPPTEHNCLATQFSFPVHQCTRHLTRSGQAKSKADTAPPQTHRAYTQGTCSITLLLPAKSRRSNTMLELVIALNMHALPAVRSTLHVVGCGLTMPMYIVCNAHVTYG